MHKILTLNSSVKVFRFLSVILIVGLLVFYIFQINTEISKRYLIKDYKKRIVELSTQNKALEISSAQNGSLDRIVELVASLNFEKTDKIHYIRILDTQIVVTN